jgi:hypothetical protein
MKNPYQWLNNIDPKNQSVENYSIVVFAANTPKLGTITHKLGSKQYSANALHFNKMFDTLEDAKSFVENILTHYGW